MKFFLGLVVMVVIIMINDKMLRSQKDLGRQVPLMRIAAIFAEVAIAYVLLNH